MEIENELNELKEMIVQHIQSYDDFIAVKSKMLDIIKHIEEQIVINKNDLNEDNHNNNIDNKLVSSQEDVYQKQIQNENVNKGNINNSFKPVLNFNYDDDGDFSVNNNLFDTKQLSSISNNHSFLQDNQFNINTNSNCNNNINNTPNVYEQNNNVNAYNNICVNNLSQSTNYMNQRNLNNSLIGRDDQNDESKEENNYINNTQPMNINDFGKDEKYQKSNYQINDKETMYTNPQIKDNIESYFYNEPQPRHQQPKTNTSNNLFTNSIKSNSEYIPLNYSNINNEPQYEHNLFNREINSYPQRNHFNQFNLYVPSQPSFIPYPETVRLNTFSFPQTDEITINKVNTIPNISKFPKTKSKASRVADILMKLNSNEIQHNIITQMFSESIFDQLISPNVDNELIDQVDNILLEIEKLEQEERFNLGIDNSYSNNDNNILMNQLLPKTQNKNYINDQSIKNNNSNNKVHKTSKNKNKNQFQKKIHLIEKELIKKYPKTSSNFYKSKSCLQDKPKPEFDFTQSLRQSNKNLHLNGEKTFVNYTSTSGGYFDPSLQKGGDSVLARTTKRKNKQDEYRKYVISPVKNYIESSNHNKLSLSAINKNNFI